MYLYLDAKLIISIFIIFLTTYQVTNKHTKKSQSQIQDRKTLLIVEQICKIKPNTFRELSEVLNHKPIKNLNDNPQKHNKNQNDHQNKDNKFDPKFIKNITQNNNNKKVNQNTNNINSDLSSINSTDNTNNESITIKHTNDLNLTNVSISYQQNYTSENEASKAHLKFLVKCITDAVRDTTDQLFLEPSFEINPHCNHDLENQKAIIMLQSNRNYKQITVEVDVYNKLIREGIKISYEVFNELLNCCLQCGDMKRACLIIIHMNKMDMFPDFDLINEFFELQNKICIQSLQYNQDNMNNNLLLNNYAQNDLSELLLKDFTQTNNNVLYDHSLDNNINNFNETNHEQYHLNTKEYYDLNQSNQNGINNAAKDLTSLKLQQQIYNLTEELLEDDDIDNCVLENKQKPVISSKVVESTDINNLHAFNIHMNDLDREMMKDYKTIHHNVFKLNEFNETHNINDQFSDDGHTRISSKKQYAKTESNFDNFENQDDIDELSKIF